MPEEHQLSKAAQDTGAKVLITAGRHYDKSRVHAFFFGKHYRDVWAAPVPAGVFDAQKIAGGLKVTKLGGGQQTTSLTLENPDGREFALRTIDKNPEGVIPEWLRLPFLTNIVLDQTSAINPYAPFVLPPMAGAAGIFHTTPRLYYVPDDDESLGEHAPEFQGKAVLFEEKFEGKEGLNPMFGEAEDFASTKKMLRKRFDQGDHLPDQHAFARARLFDVLIGDWDRHEGQWEWAEYKEKDKTVYRPVPKDRDQVFFKFDDGVVPWIVSRRFLIRKFRTFKEEVKDLEGLIFNAQFIDHRVLNELTAEDWQKAATEMKTALTDEVIENAIRLFPDTVYQLVGAETIAKLKSRRDQLPGIAHEFYRILAQEVSIVGSDQEDKFEVTRLSDTETAVTVYLYDEDNPSASLQTYSRVFLNKDTKHLTLYGLERDDIFELEGKANKGIKITIFGGPGEDEIIDKSEVQQGHNRVLIRDTLEGAEIEEGKNTKKRLTPDVRVHAFDREGF